MIETASKTTGIRDNRERGSVGAFLRDHVGEKTSLSVVSAYFTIYAYYALRDELDSIDALRFLFGEPRFIHALDPNKTDKKAFNIEDEGLALRNRLEQNRVAKACAAWIKNKVEIRSIKQSGLLHGKLYHIEKPRADEAIMGSSNFTVRGLGLAETGNNIELNLVVQDRRDLADLKAWFDTLWDDDTLVEDVKDEVLGYLEQLYTNHSPEFIYYKTLFHLFDIFLEEQDDSGLLSETNALVDTGIWCALFEFQRDGVRGAINKLLHHNGCIIADSVGLGKTFEALAVIKYFEGRNDRVLVLCPKKLRENWTVYQAQNNSETNLFIDDRFAYTVLSHTDLSRGGGVSGDINLETLNWGNYDLVVIDESHNFRNNTKGKRDEEGHVIRKSRYERLMQDIIQSGRSTKVLLLSATPVNNDLKDLRNQLMFMTGDNDHGFRDSIGLTSVSDVLNEAQKRFNVWVEGGERRTRDLLESLPSPFFKLLDELTIARSRRHIETYYPEVMARLGGFPKRLKPIARYPDLDIKDEFMPYDRLNEEISRYSLSLFNPSNYMLPEHEQRYLQTGVRNFSQSVRENYLVGMMKVGFLKRLESSVYAFRLTLERTIQKIEDVETRIERFKALRAKKANAAFNPDVPLYREDMPLFESADAYVDDEGLLDLDDEELQDAMQVGKKFVYRLEHLDVDRWLVDLGRDRRKLERLLAASQKISPDRDAKLAELKTLIRAKIEGPTLTKRGEENRKVIVFTAFADTAKYLYGQLSGWAGALGVHSALVVGGSGGNRTTFGDTDFNRILTNFAPVAKKRRQMPSMAQEGEIDLLIATDCISEGQNLQDCDYLVNYDIHWNPVRIIQRFGRIDRIGSLGESVQLVNFWPTEDLNAYINLRSRVEARMALVDLSATSEDNLLSTETLETIAAEELKYRDKQLLRLKDEVLDLEEMDENIALNEFTLEDFRVDLVKYLEVNRQTLQDAPYGLYAVVSAPKAHPVIQPGVIFCLAQKRSENGGEANKAINPLYPYYLVYVRDDGEVRYTFAQPKQILEMYRNLCVGENVAFEELCRRFDEQTQNGEDMSHYSRLVESAVASLAQTYKRREANNLRQRGAILSKKQEKVEQTTDFNLISWLIIKGDVEKDTENNTENGEETSRA